MNTPYLPIPSEPRYTITHEATGHVLRFDGDAIATSDFLSPMIIAAQNHSEHRAACLALMLPFGQSEQ